MRACTCMSTRRMDTPHSRKLLKFCKNLDRRGKDQENIFKLGISTSAPTRKWESWKYISLLGITRHCYDAWDERVSPNDHYWNYKAWTVEIDSKGVVQDKYGGLQYLPCLRRSVGKLPRPGLTKEARVSLHSTTIITHTDLRRNNPWAESQCTSE